jgi:hypothetical protein
MTLRRLFERDGHSGGGRRIVPALSNLRNISRHEMSFNTPFGDCHSHNLHIIFDNCVRVISGFWLIIHLISDIRFSVSSGLVIVGKWLIRH